MDKDLFEFDESLDDGLEESLDAKEEKFRIAEDYILKGEYKKALKLYEELEEECSDERVRVGFLRAHSHNYTIFDDQGVDEDDEFEIDSDIAILEELHPEYQDKDYLDYKRRRDAFHGKLKEQREKEDREFWDNIKKSREESQNNPEEINRQGDVFYERGDYVSAYKQYEKAAKYDYALAYLNLGHMLYHGLGVSKDIEKSMEMYKAAVKLKEYRGSYAVGYYYLNTKKDYQNALNYFREGYYNGDDKSCAVGIGYMYMNGLGVELNYQKGVEFLKYGFEEQKLFAGQWLGYAYENGLGVLRNYQTAYNYYLQAAEKGDEYSKERMRSLISRGLVLR